jgi:hypothetical protein
VLLSAVLAVRRLRRARIANDSAEAEILAGQLSGDEAAQGRSARPEWRSTEPPMNTR